MIKETLWVEKYRPKTFDGYVFHDSNQEQILRGFVREGSIPHLLLSGIQGSGKTTLAFILLNELNVEDADALIINASEQNDVNTMRDKISQFVKTHAFGEFKVVLLEEADYLSPNSQSVLRRLMEEYSDFARFVLTCNYVHRLIPAIQSRCQHMTYKAPNKVAVTEYIAKVLISERVTFNLEDLDALVGAFYPDIRKIVNTAQLNSSEGKLLVNTTVNSADYNLQLVDMIRQDDWAGMRTFLCDCVRDEEWEDVYKLIYQNLNLSPKLSADGSKYDEAVVQIAEYLYRHPAVADAEINFAACIIQLNNI